MSESPSTHGTALQKNDNLETHGHTFKTWSSPSKAWSAPENSWQSPEKTNQNS